MPKFFFFLRYSSSFLSIPVSVSFIYPNRFILFLQFILQMMDGRFIQIVLY